MLLCPIRSSLQFTNTSSSNKDSLIMNKLSLTRRRIPTTDPIAISKIYPTPPSVETTDKRYDEVEMMEDNHHHHSMWNDGEVSMREDRFNQDTLLVNSGHLALIRTLYGTLVYHSFEITYSLLRRRVPWMMKWI